MSKAKLTTSEHSYICLLIVGWPTFLCCIEPFIKEMLLYPTKVTKNPDK